MKHHLYLGLHIKDGKTIFSKTTQEKVEDLVRPGPDQVLMRQTIMMWIFKLDHH